MTPSKPSAGGSFRSASISRSTLFLYSSGSVNVAMSMAAMKLFWMPRLTSRVPDSCGSSSGLPTIRLDRHSNISASPDPFGPPAGSRMSASFGSVVGSPAEVAAQLRAYEAAGLATAMVHFPVGDPESVELFAERVMPGFAP